MGKLKQFWIKWQSVLLIILLSILAYGLLIPWLGFYMDDWTFSWTYQTFGAQGLFKYFSTNRPVWGLLYQLTLPIFGKNVLLWQLFDLFWRIAASLSFYWLIQLLWPKKHGLALAAGLLFAVYPGFLLQPLAITFGHIWIIYSVFLLSNCLTVLAVRFPAKRTLYSALALLLSLVNVLCMEYFLPLEVIRLVLLFYLVAEPLPFFKRVWKAIQLWLPYLAVLLLVTIYRAFFFTDQTHIYSLQLLDTFKHSIGAGFVQLFQEVISALYQSAVFAWVQPFSTIAARFSSNRTFLGVLGLLVIVFAGLVWWTARSWRADETGKNRAVEWSALIVAVCALLLAGIPFYVTSLPVQASAINSRFTLPFMLGAALLLAFALELIPWRVVRAVLLSALLAAAVGFNLLNENDFRALSVQNNEMMYELSWRAPNLQPGTLLITSEQNQYFTFSTLRAELNLVYPHDSKATYGWIFGRDLASIVSTPLQENTAISFPMIVQDISGNSDLAAVFELNGNGCLRFIDKDSSFIPMDIETYSYQNISNAAALVGGGQAVKLNQQWIGPEPEHGWCYYFEKSDLALQNKDYASIQKYYQTVKEKSLKPHEGYELTPFIEGLAGAGDWSTALTLAQQAIRESPASDAYPVSLCKALNAIAGEAPSSAAQQTLNGLNCQK